MSELRDELDQALGAVPVGLPPLDRVLRDGHRLRIRRRAAVTAGILAVVAVLAGYPVLARVAAAPTAPVTGHHAAGHHAAGHDPVVTDSPATKGSVSGDIAQGTIGQVWWQLRVYPDNTQGDPRGDICYQPTVSTASYFSRFCGVDPAGPADGVPATFSGMSAGAYEGALGMVGGDVAYFVLTFNDGQRLKLIPVSYEGHRYVAWTAPASMTIKSVTAHLGARGVDSGQTESTFPFDRPGAPIVFGAWYKPGQPLPPTGSAVLARGGSGSRAWTAVAHLGPWGTCFEAQNAGKSSEMACLPGTSHKTGVYGSSSTPSGQRVDFMTAAPGIATLRITLSDGSTVSVTPVSVANERLAAFGLPRNVTVSGWTGYDTAGHVVAAG
jgi:hypothetical protein